MRSSLAPDSTAWYMAWSAGDVVCWTTRSVGMSSSILEAIGVRFGPLLPRVCAVLLLGALVPACSDADPPPAAASTSSASSPAPATSTSIAVDTRSAELQAVVNAFVGGQTVAFSVVVLELSTGARAEHLADRRVPSASLYK